MASFFKKISKMCLLEKKIKPRRLVSQKINASLLPPKTIRGKKIEEKSKVESIKPLPFSIEEVGKALNIPPNKIRKISRLFFGDEFEIIFKPSISKKKVTEISKVLAKKDIENVLNGFDNEITIQPLGAEDFVKLDKNSQPK